MEALKQGVLRGEKAKKRRHQERERVSGEERETLINK